jgi:hypothetical protein
MTDLVILVFSSILSCASVLSAASSLSASQAILNLSFLFSQSFIINAVLSAAVGSYFTGSYLSFADY